MARRPKPKSFAAPTPGAPAAKAPRQQVIPEAVANRMVRRIAIATGTPTFLGMGVFVASYLLVSRGVLDIPPGLTLVGSGAFFLLGLVGLSYGVLSASWEDAPGSLLGLEQIGVNIRRVRSSVRAMRQGTSSSGSGSPQG
ncbi:PAM68 family protein [Synechococcus sp. BA-132 BA5]|uniref:PAM68 family protein n=1 Tax=Synechococcus sp. BA-132 BA5 TaxID=3110252 RepID=UPI002B1F0E10|nr:PAM68 family protein [Synechococcus sp. BA-132 BA5]MEA5413927.1 PAM68 family protein [Synechococcus sp. BA-132 BA5]